jgi:indolepyruvate decarboxylase
MAKEQSLGEFLFHYLYHEKNIRHAFGIPGDFALPTFRWLENSPIELITMTHEPSVGFAADSYARVNGLGLACVTYCVGGLNMVNSIACAYAEKSPVIVLSGGPSLNDRRNDPLLHHKVKTFDTQRRIFEEVTCANTVLLDPKTAVSEIMRVVETVQAECRPGYIEIPYDIVDLPVVIPAYLPKQYQPESDTESLSAFIHEITHAINHAKQPVIIADIELHRHGLTDKVVEISQKFSLPISATLLSKSIVSETNPLYIGVYSGGLSEPACQKYVEESDCVIMLGTFITDVFLGQYTAHLDRKKSIMVTTEKATIGLHSYSNILFPDFLNAFSNAPIKRKEGFVNPNPVVEIPPLTPAEYDEPLGAESFFTILSLHLGEGSTVICDTGDSLLGAIGLRTTKRKNFLSDAYYLSMGFAVPAAIGALAGNEEGRVFAIVGDGAFQMTGMELSTAVKYNMAPIVLILNNDGYGTQRHIIDGAFNVINMWDYTKVTDVIKSGFSVQVKTKKQLEDALVKALSMNEIAVIEVVIPRDDCSPSLRKMGEQLGKLRDKSKRSN